MAKWVIDLKRSQTEIAEENFPKPPGYNDDLETVSAWGSVEYLNALDLHRNFECTVPSS